MRGHYEIAYFILDNIELNNSYFKLKGHRNGNSVNTLDILIQINNTAAFSLFKHFMDYFLNYEFVNVSKTCFDVVALAYYFGN